jgi:hypothetical protein
LDAVSSGPKTRIFVLSSRITSHSNPPISLLCHSCFPAGEIFGLKLQAAVGMQICAHAPRTRWRAFTEFREQPAVGVEQSLGACNS